MDTERLPFVAAVRSLYQETMGRECPFHLAPCGQCGGPSFQQPCSLCGYYPMGVRAKKPERPWMSCEAFERVIDRSGIDQKGGNIATWYARTFERSVAHRESLHYREEVSDFVLKAQRMEGLPTAREIYDLVAVQEKSLMAPREEPAEDTPGLAP